MHSTEVAPPSSFPIDKTTLPLSQPLKKFYLGEPLALGITQVLMAIMGIAFATVVDTSFVDFDVFIDLKTPYWSNILYLISGSLSVAAAKISKISLAKGMLGMNIVSAVAAGSMIIFLWLDFQHSQRGGRHWCDSYRSEVDEKLCEEYYAVPFNVAQGVMALLLVFNIFEFCIALSTSAFGCKALCRDSYVETVVVVYQNVTPASTVTQDPPEVPQVVIPSTQPSRMAIF